MKNTGETKKRINALSIQPQFISQSVFWKSYLLLMTVILSIIIFICV